MLRFSAFKLLRNIGNANKNSLACVRFSSSHMDIEKPNYSVSYNELYSPEGCFYEDYNKKNKLYTKYLVGSIVFFAISVYAYFELNCFRYHDMMFPKFENTPEGLEFMEVGRKAFLKQHEEYEAEYAENPDKKPPIYVNKGKKKISANTNMFRIVDEENKTLYEEKTK